YKEKMLLTAFLVRAISQSKEERRSTLLRRGDPPVGDIPIVLQRIGVAADISGICSHHQNIHICIEGNKIDLRGQTFEKAVIGLDAARKGYGIAPLAQSL